MRSNVRRAAPYATSVVLVVALVALRWLLIPDWSLAHPYLLFVPAIIIAAWYGGFGPGLLATILGAFALSYLWLPPLYSLRIRDIRDASSLLVFVASGFAISLLAEALLQAHRRASQPKRQAQQ
jgi:two-component system, sensor histidine kinase and response regulator